MAGIAAGKTGKLKKMVGENTAGIRTNKKGKKYAIIQEDNYGGPNAGDSIFIGNVPLIKNKKTGAGYSHIPGGDYEVKKTGTKKYEMAKNLSMPKGKLGSNLRKAEYDARNWKYDKTIK
jgi:hypothetical protein